MQVWYQSLDQAKRTVQSTLHHSLPLTYPTTIACSPHFSRWSDQCGRMYLTWFGVLRRGVHRQWLNYSYNINGQGFGIGYTTSSTTSQTPTITLTAGTGLYAPPWTAVVRAMNIAGYVDSVTTASFNYFPQPVIWYKFNSGDYSGTTIYNWATGLYDANTQATATVTTSNPSPVVGSGCFNINGSNYITLNNQLISSNTNAQLAGWSTYGWTPKSSLGYTWSMWFYWNGTSSGLLFNWTTGNIYQRFGLSPEGIINWGASFNGNMTSSFTTNTWHHMAFVIPPNISSTSTALLYIDGTLNRTLSNNTPGAEYQSYQPNYIGRENQGGGSTYQSAIDDFRFFALALTSTQISSIYNKTV